MKTRSVESKGSLSSYRPSLRPAMNGIFTAPFLSRLMRLGPQPWSARCWSLEYVIYVSLLMGLDEAEGLKDRFAHARQAVVALFPGRKRPGQSYQGYVKACRRLRRGHRRAIRRQLRAHHRWAAGPYWQRDGWVAFAADGTRVELPRTAANEKAFGCAGRDKSGPQLQLTSLYHMGTGLPWAWQIGAGTESEQVHLRHLARQLPAGSLLVADAGFTSFDLLWSLRKRQVHFLVRMGSNRTLLTGLEDARVQIRGEIVWLWPTQKQSQDPPLKLRLLRLQQANHTPMCLVTSVLDEQALPDPQIGQFYRMRWGQEVFHRAFKQTLAQHTMRSHSPAQARSELDWALMGYRLLGLWSVEALGGAGCDPRTSSVGESLRVARRAVRQGGRLGRGTLASLLRRATKDGYVRTRPKAARNWPRKKNDRPPGLPKLREATEKEKHRATKTYERTKAT
jgi:Transposase DDE domain